MSTEPEPTYVVVATAACERFLPGPDMGPEWCERFRMDLSDVCDGCLRNGRRALLDTAQPVERQPIIGAFRHFWAYVAIADRDASARVPIDTWPPADPEEQP